MSAVPSFLQPSFSNQEKTLYKTLLKALLTHGFTQSSVFVYRVPSKLNFDPRVFRNLLKSNPYWRSLLKVGELDYDAYERILMWVPFMQETNSELISPLVTFKDNDDDDNDVALKEYRGTGGGYTQKTYSFLSNDENAQLQKARDRSEELLEKYSYLENEDDDFNTQLQNLGNKYKIGGKKTKSKRKTRRSRSQKKKMSQRSRSQKKRTSQRSRLQKKRTSQKRRTRH